MTKAFALECGPDNIRVNAVLPGLTDTKFAGALTGDAANIEFLVKANAVADATPSREKWPAPSCSWRLQPPVSLPAVASP